jgi:hypothetical protein
VNYTTQMNYIVNRTSYLLSQMPEQMPFEILTNGGGDVIVPDTTVVLSGSGWVNVREIRLAGSDEALPLTWLDDETWEVVVPIDFGENVVTLEARDHQGFLVGSDTINVESTATNAVLEYLRIVEVMYHPSDPTGAEIPAGYEDDDFEFIELLNTSQGGNSVTIDLTGVVIDAGVSFAFAPGTMLTAGERILVVRNQAAFELRYGTGLNVAGEYLTAASNKLDNSGDDLRLRASSGLTVLNFHFEDQTAEGWYDETDGQGSSLILIDASIDPADYNLPASWRASYRFGGSPGAADPIPSDLNADGRIGLADLALLQSYLAADVLPPNGDPTQDGQLTRADIARVTSLFGRNYSFSTLSGSPVAAPAAVDQAHAETNSQILRSARSARAARRANLWHEADLQRPADQETPPSASSLRASVVRRRR